MVATYGNYFNGTTNPHKSYQLTWSDNFLPNPVSNTSWMNWASGQPFWNTDGNWWRYDMIWANLASRIRPTPTDKLVGGWATSDHYYGGYYYAMCRERSERRVPGIHGSGCRCWAGAPTAGGGACSITLPADVPG
jgi:hypothetical protein